ncbi:MAG TPA: DUF1559 domain-containing protein [Gemmataceae bacterium]|nr:DUF1559 domain-containing protein [Gemmataceae bacterium]
MAGSIKTLAAILVGGTLLGLVILLVGHARAKSGQVQCTNNLKLLGLGIHGYHDANRRFPAATHDNPQLPPDKRFSWLIGVFPAYMEAGPFLLIDKAKAWDASENSPLHAKLVTSQCEVISEDFVMGELSIFLCPNNPARMQATMPAVTHYVGVSGVGTGASLLPIEDAKAGIFGHHRKVTLKDLQHGTETTIMAAETLDVGPWTAGGHATVRDLIPDALPYFGEEAQFGANHRSVSNVLFADASVRTFDASLNPRLAEAMAALAGKVDQSQLDD